MQPNYLLICFVYMHYYPLILFRHLRDSRFRAFVLFNLQLLFFTINIFKFIFMKLEVHVSNI